MCLAAIALGASSRFPLVVAANRDEWLDRPTAPLAWWPAREGHPAWLGGRDLAAGGSWLAVGKSGRAALLTNIREPGRFDPAAPSRGRLVLDWLDPATTAEALAARAGRAGHNGFNLIALDRGRGWWLSNRAPAPVLLAPGLHGLSNALLDTPWPKVVALEARLAAALAAARDADDLAQQLWPALADRNVAPDSDLPATGVPLELERALSPAFVRIEGPGQRVHATRCSTLLIGDGRRLRVQERRYDDAGAVTGESVFAVAT